MKSEKTYKRKRYPYVGGVTIRHMETQLVANIPITNSHLYCMVSFDDLPKLAPYLKSLYLNRDGYVYLFKMTTKKVHRFLLNPPADKQVDHIDRNKLNNTRNNLRIVTAKENALNKGPVKGKKYKGVSFRKDKKKFQAQARDGQEKFHLGYYDKEEDAARKYDEWVKERYGNLDYVYLNGVSDIPEEIYVV